MKNQLAFLITALLVGAPAFADRAPQSRKAEKPFSLLETITIQKTQRGCLGRWALCIVNEDCCSKKCGGFGARACLPKEW